MDRLLVALALSLFALSLLATASSDGVCGSDSGCRADFREPEPSPAPPTMADALDDPLAALSVRELRELLAQRGVGVRDLNEKADLLARTRATLQAESTAPLRTRVTTTSAGLRCLVVDAGARASLLPPKPSLLVVVLHGYGANAEDLASIGIEMVGSD